MRKAIKQRLAAAEQQLRSKDKILQVIRINGGLPGPIRWAEGGGRVWERAPDEAYDVGVWSAFHGSDFATYMKPNINLMLSRSVKH